MKLIRQALFIQKTKFFWPGKKLLLFASKIAILWALEITPYFFQPTKKMAAKPDASGDVRRQLRSSLERHVFSGNQRHFARLNIHLV